MNTVVSYLRISIVFFSFACTTTLLNQSLLGSPQSNFEEKRQQIDVDFQADLERLAKKCDELKLEKQAKTTRNWIINRLPDRQTIFVPNKSASFSIDESQPNQIRFWYRAFLKARAKQADRLYGLANEIRVENPTQAFQLLHECLHENPNHPRATKALPNRFEISKSAIKVGKKAHKNRALPKRTLVTVANTPNFRIMSLADKAATQEVAEKFERWHEVWRQVFYSYWATETDLAQRLKGTPKEKPKKHFVILYQNKKQYIDSLTDLIPGIENSIGYYSDAIRQSFFFYDGEGENVEKTWRHELTHQLFSESISTVKDPVRERGVWALEGIALYMESLRDFKTHVTVGGFDAERLQYARLRRFREQFKFPPSELFKMSQREFQSNRDVRKLYTLSAGYSHLLMDGNARKTQPAFLNYIKQIYKSRSAKPDLLKDLGEFANDNESFELQYAKFLYVDKNNVPKVRSNFAESRVLSFLPSNLDDQSLAALSNAPLLTELDLSNTKITDAGIENLRTCKNLSDLYLDSTSITDESLKTIGRMSRLTELDLSNTNVTSAGMKQLANLQSLKVLWLTKTQVDDDAIDDLLKLKSLEMLEVTGSKISASGKVKLSDKFPRQ